MEDRVPIDLESVLKRVEGKSLEQKYGYLQAAYQDAYNQLAALQAKLAEAVGLLKWVIEHSSDCICAKGRRDIEAFLASTPSEYVAVQREDLKIANDYLFCIKSLPLVGKDREAANRLKGALEGK